MMTLLGIEMIYDDKKNHIDYQDMIYEAVHI